ncbi:MAG: response regulator [Desulfobulbaceae bacterium]|nr:response regulator [Desulfobulbaceae bacterium]
MKPEKSFRSTLTWSMILVAVLSVGMVGSFWIYQEYVKYTTEFQKQKDVYIGAQKAAIKQEVNRVLAYIDFKKETTEQNLKNSIHNRVYEAVAVAQNIYNSWYGRKSDEEIQTLIKEALGAIRFNKGRGYFYIYDMQGNNVLLPFSPHLEGKNLWELQDSKGDYTIQRATEIIREDGEGFQRWYWYKPGENRRMSEKIGFHKKFEPYDWWIGTGEYIEDFRWDIQQETLDWIRKIRFGEDGYIFAFDFTGTTLAHFIQETIGQNRWDFKDTNGVSVIEELIRISQQVGGGFLDYVGLIRPSTGLAASKIGYAHAVKDWKWTVGAGVYVDSINDIIAIQHKILVDEIVKNILLIFVFLAVSLLLIVFLLRYISRKTTDNLAIFTSFFEQAATDSLIISDDSIHFSEFKSLAQSANQMVTERNRASAILEKLQEQLIRSRKMEALGVLAGGVAHDLNNVLSAMVGYPDLILANLPADSSHRKYILTIKDSGVKAASIVQDLLTLARRGVAQMVILNINSIIENYLQSPEHQKIMKDNPGIYVTANLAPDLMMLSGSQVHLQKTIMNLLANAAEAQPNGGSIHIKTENRYVDLQAHKQSEIKEGEYIFLSVEDKGYGIGTSDLEHIFEPFFTKKHPGKSGTGLGMAVVWGTVQDHEGYIDVVTAENLGTTFELYFPATRDEIIDMGKVDEIADLCGNGESILIVDDLREQRELAMAIFKKLGYRAESAASGEEALEYLKQHQVDLLFLDMIMEPGIDGLETFKRSLLLHPNQRAIIASGYTETDRVKAAISIGVGQYVKKPYTVNTVGKAVKDELS